MKHNHEHCALHIAFRIAGMTLKAAAVAVAFCAVHELHKIHKSIKA